MATHGYGANSDKCLPVSVSAARLPKLYYGSLLIYLYFWYYTNVVLWIISNLFVFLVLGFMFLLYLKHLRSYVLHLISENKVVL
ncbi:hypothetical protein NMG60_11000895 [Bertholletia excelsa]